MEVLILVGLWFLFLWLTFRSPDAPRITRLLSFLILLALSASLAFMFAVKVLGYDPEPDKWRIAHWLTEDRIIDLAEIAPGVYDYSWIYRIDTDAKPEKNGDEAQKTGEDWFVFYRYDVVGADSDKPKGPFGAAVYDPDNCRPPSILSFELVPINYDYLAQDDASVEVANVIEYKDPISSELDRPEIVLTGKTRGEVTDLNMFRKIGAPPDCSAVQQWRRQNPYLPYPYTARYGYDNIGSFRGSYKVRLDGSTVTVWDRGVLERSQLTVRKQYRPVNGCYFDMCTQYNSEVGALVRPPKQVLLDPVEYSVDFGPGQPSDVPQVYYPEKAVLAFYLNLGKDSKKLEEAKSWLSPAAQQIYNLKTDPFGLSTEETNPARARDKLSRVLVYEIRYQPDIQAEQLHEDREVTVSVVGVNDKGGYDNQYVCQVTWTVVAVPNPQALPYGCEWGLEAYWTTCPPGQK